MTLFCCSCIVFSKAVLCFFQCCFILTIFTDFDVCQPKSWKFIQEQLELDPILVIELYSKFLFFSVSTATLCGQSLCVCVCVRVCVCVCVCVRVCVCV